MWPLDASTKRVSPPSRSTLRLGVLPRHDVVVDAGDDVAVDGDRRQVDGLAERRELAGAGERVVEREPDEVAVQAGGQADRVLVPEQDVERGRRLAQQVVVDDVVPDQVVRAQPREHAGQRLAVDVAAAGGLGDRERGQFLAGERGGGAGLLVVERAHQQRQAGDAVGAGGAERGGAEDAAGAGGVEVDGLRARALGDGGAGLEDRGRVGVEVEVAVLVARVAPGDHEHALALLDQVLDHAAAGREVEHVELVDRRRDEQQRDLADGLGLRRVLDQLVDVGPLDHGAGREREVLADAEPARVDRRGQARGSRTRTGGRRARGSRRPRRRSPSARPGS